MVLLHQGRKRGDIKERGENFSRSLPSFFPGGSKRELWKKRKVSSCLTLFLHLPLNFTVGETEQETHFMAVKQYSRSFLNREVILDKIVPKRFGNRRERERESCFHHSSSMGENYEKKVKLTQLHNLKWGKKSQKRGVKMFSEKGIKDGNGIRECKKWDPNFLKQVCTRVIEYINGRKQMK